MSGVLVGRGVLRNPWILAQAADLAAGREPRVVTMADRGQFLLDYIDLLLRERVDEEHGFRHEAPMTAEERARMHSGPAQGRERWVINKLRALNSWYTKGIRRRVAPAHRGEQRHVDRRAARSDSHVLHE